MRKKQLFSEKSRLQDFRVAKIPGPGWPKKKTRVNIKGRQVHTIGRREAKRNGYNLGNRVAISKTSRDKKRAVAWKLDQTKKKIGATHPSTQKREKKS